MKKILKIFYTLIVAAFLGLAKSFGYKTEYKEADKGSRIESEK